MRRIVRLAGLVVGLALLSGCRAGPGHTRAAGAIGGTAAGAAIGAAVADAAGGYGTDGAIIGGLLGFMAGSAAGEGIAQDQERRCCENPECEGCRPVRRPVRRCYPPRRVVVYEEVYGPCGPPCWGPPPPPPVYYVPCYR